jgi:electron transport protein HydN
MNRFVIAEPDKCIGCRTCEIACALAHQVGNGEEALSPRNFAPRLTVIRNATVTTPVLCRQCDDAPCVRACPNGAIVYAQDSVQVEQSRCIGCKSCVVACPYGAMNVVAVPDRSAGAGSVYASQRQRAEAHKCDLCVTRSSGPACIPACPTKALHLVDHETMVTTLRKRQEQAAMALASGVQI